MVVIARETSGGYTLGTGTGAGRGQWRQASLTPAARPISQAGSRSSTQQIHSTLGPCQSRSAYRALVSCQSHVPARAQGVKHKVVVNVGTEVETCIAPHSARQDLQ